MKQTIQNIWSNAAYRFLLVGSFLFLVWLIGYQFYLKPFTPIDLVVIENLIGISSWVLELIGFSLIPESTDATIRTIGIDGTHGLWIGDPCNGLTLFALFSGFVLAFPGPIKHKAWYLPLGLIIIHLVNVLRVLGLSLIIFYFPNPDVLDFNHTYTFTVIVYSVVFGLWVIWVNRLSGIKTLP